MEAKENNGETKLSILPEKSVVKKKKDSRSSKNTVAKRFTCCSCSIFIPESDLLNLCKRCLDNPITYNFLNGKATLKHVDNIKIQQ